jgi:hypothetical protein
LHEVGGVETGEARAELLDVSEKSLTDGEELRGRDTDAVEGEDGVDEVVCFVNDNDVAVVGKKVGIGSMWKRARGKKGSLLQRDPQSFASSLLHEHVVG